jgi:hypothetical protein
MDYLISPSFLAHDCYILFDKVMKKIGHLFVGTVEEDSDVCCRAHFPFFFLVFFFFFAICCFISFLFVVC